MLKLAQPLSEDTGIWLRRTYQCIIVYIYCLPCLQLKYKSNFTVLPITTFTPLDTD